MMDTKYENQYSAEPSGNLAMDDPRYREWCDANNARFVSAMAVVYPGLVTMIAQQQPPRPAKTVEVAKPAATVAISTLPLVREITTTAPTPRALVMQIAKEHGMSDADLLSRDRRKQVVMARAQAYERLRKEYNFSVSRIGRMFGRHHTTILHALAHHLQPASEAQVGKATGDMG